MRALHLIVGVALCACTTESATAPLVRDLTHVDRVFQVTWAATDVSATLIDRSATPDNRALLALGISVIERMTKCTVIDARLPDGALTVSAQIDCNARAVLEI